MLENKSDGVNNDTGLVETGSKALAETSLQDGDNTAGACAVPTERAHKKFSTGDKAK